MAKLKASKGIWGNRFVTISYRLLFRTVLISDQTSHNDQHFSHIKHTSHQVLIACVGYFWAPAIRFFTIQKIFVPEHEQKDPQCCRWQKQTTIKSRARNLKEGLTIRFQIFASWLMIVTPPNVKWEFNESWMFWPAIYWGFRMLSSLFDWIVLHQTCSHIREIVTFCKGKYCTNMRQQHIRP